jgi:peroxiredoxin
MPNSGIPSSKIICLRNCKTVYFCSNQPSLKIEIMISRAKIFYLFVLTILFAGLQGAATAQNTGITFKMGNWVGVIQLNDANHNSDMPFNFVHTYNRNGKQVVEIVNAGERIVVTEFNIKDDTLRMKLPVFQSEIIAIILGDQLIGTYYPKGRVEGNGYKFTATCGITERFYQYKEKAAVNITGKYEITENPGTADEAKTLGEFFQIGDLVTGSILTTSGDYRYLDGKVSGRKFMVSAIDGAHTLLITADVSADGSLINGKFVGSRKWKSEWKGVKNPTFALPKADELVKVSDPNIKFNFAFPDMEGKTVKLSDPRFNGKVVIIQAAGSWCPNCMDEVRYYKPIYDELHAKGLEIITLCFETKDYDKSKQRIIRFRDAIGAKFVFLHAGEAGSKDRAAAFPMLQGAMAFPSTVFIDRKGVIRKVETGFSGPGTGQHYLDYAKETKLFIEQLLSEN